VEIVVTATSTTAAVMALKAKPMIRNPKGSAMLSSSAILFCLQAQFAEVVPPVPAQKKAASVEAAWVNSVRG
jgi:hypothetical protein